MTIAINDAQRPLTENEARELTAKIYGAIEVAWELIAEAYQRRADKALGYSSWDEYCKAEFNGSRLRLPREERQEKVRSLRESGLSTRAIASATGTAQTQVRRDLASGEPKGSPESEPVTGLDGKTYTPPEPDNDVVDAEIVEEPTAAEPERAAPRRALTDQFFDAAYDLNRAAERAHKLAADDRWPKNKEQIALKHKSDLLQAADLLAEVIAAMPHN